MPIEERRHKQADATALYRQRHPDRCKESQERFARNHPERVKVAQNKYNIKRWKEDPEFRRGKSEYEKIRRKKIQQEAIDHYGGKCYCCGETIRQFLGLDHKNGGGTKHRKELTVTVAEWAKRNGWPDTLRSACHNCNIGAHLNGGVCPHQKVGG
jgi:hypothetical protein